MAELITDTANLVDQILIEHYEIDQNLIAQAAWAPLRLKILTAASAAYGKIWNGGDFTFKYVANAEITIPVVTDPTLPSATLPAPMISTGAQGGVWRKNEPYGQLTWRRLGWTLDQLTANPKARGVPMFYSVRGTDLIASIRPTEATPLYVSYKMARPRLFDDATVLDLPEPWRLTVWWPETLWRLMERDGDVQGMPAVREQAKEGLYDMLCEEPIGEPTPMFMPRYGGALSISAFNE